MDRYSSSGSGPGARNHHPPDLLIFLGKADLLVHVQVKDVLGEQVDRDGMETVLSYTRIPACHLVQKVKENRRSYTYIWRCCVDSWALVVILFVVVIITGSLVISSTEKHSKDK